MPKKICFITTIPSTLEAFVYPLAEHLAAHTDWDVTFITGMDEPYARPLPPGVRSLFVHMHRGMRLGLIRSVWELFSVFRRERFDLVQYSTPNAAFCASLAAWLARVPVRLYCQWGIVYVGFSGLKRRIFKTLEKTVCLLSTRIEPDSFGNLRFSRSEGLYPESKSSVVWNGSACGVDLNKFDLSQRPRWRKELRGQLSIPENAPVFGFVGRITGDKGINELFIAFRRIIQVLPDARLMLVGGMEKTGSIDSALYDWARQEPWVLFCGSTNVVEQYLSAMDIFVLPSYREGFGAVVVEAEAMGLPVIVTDIPGPTDGMRENETGLIVKKADVDSLYDAMLRLAQDGELRRRLGDAAPDYIRNSFEQQQLLCHIVADRKRLMGDGT